jgi:hypothetical protein
MSHVIQKRWLAVATAAAMAWAFTAGGCSSSSTPATGGDAGDQDSGGNPDGKTNPGDTGGGGDTKETPETGSPETGPTEGGQGETGPGDGGAEAGCTGTELTVINAPSSTPWCTVTVGSNTPFTGGSQTFCLPSGTSVDLSATANPGFVLAATNWHDQTGTETVPGTTTDTPTGAKACVWVCCPGEGGSPACPTTDQCP